MNQSQRIMEALGEKLNTETDTLQMEKRILKAAEKHFGVPRGVKLKAVFEHGQWWVLIDDPGRDEQATYSVADASGPGTVDGFDFEEV